MNSNSTSTYVDAHGRKWTLTNIEAADIPGFFRATKHDGKMVLIHRDQIKKSEPKETKS